MSSDLTSTTSRALLRPSADVRSDAAFRILAWGLVAIGVLRLLTLVPAAASHLDFSHYYLSARIALDGDNPYATPLKPLCEEYGLQYHPNIPYGANPPLLIRMFMLFAWLPPKWAYVVWLCVQVSSLFALIAVTRRLVAWRFDQPWGLVWLAVVLNSNAVFHHFRYSQVQLLIAAALAAATWLAIRRRRHAAIGIVAVAAAFKLYPAVLLPWFMLTGLSSWRDFAKRSLIVGGVLAAALAATGPAMWASFFKDGIPVIEISIGRYVSNYSLQSAVVLVHNTMRDVLLGPASGDAIRWLGKGLAIGAIAAAYWLVWRRRFEEVRAVGLLSVAMIAASVVCWSHYFVLLIPAATLLVVNAKSAATPLGKYVPPLFACLALMPKTGGVPPTGQGPLGRAGQHLYFLLHMYPVLVLALFAVCLVLTAQPALRRSMHRSTKAA